MSYRWVEHTAEVELRIDADSEDAVFREALAALGELIGDGGAPGGTSYVVTVAAPDRAALLAAWLDELVYRAETEDLVPDAVDAIALAGDTLTATVRAHRGKPRHYVKGVTYHALSFDAGDPGFRATVVLDV